MVLPLMLLHCLAVLLAEAASSPLRRWALKLAQACFDAVSVVTGNLWCFKLWPRQVLKDQVAQGVKSNNRRGEVKAKDTISSAPGIPKIVHEGNHKGSVDSLIQQKQYFRRCHNDTIYPLCRFHATAISEQFLGRPCEHHPRY